MKLLDILGGSLVGTVVDTVKEYFPPDMSEAEKAKAELAMTKAVTERERMAEDNFNKGMQLFNDRVKALEGTAADLKTIPILGPLIIFLRGAQRPTWGFAVLYFDWVWFTTETASKFTPQQELALVIINALVLTFLFGERALKNLMPMILKFWESRIGVAK